MVNEIDVSDDEAIRLGQFTAKNLESGGVERIDPVTTSQLLGNDKIGRFANLLLSSPDEDKSLSEALESNAGKALLYLRRNGAISDTQYSSAMDRKGYITPEAKSDLVSILKRSLFMGATPELPTMFDALPAKAQKAILSVFMRDFASIEDNRILPEIQKAIECWYEAAGTMENFTKTGNYESACHAMKDFLKQTSFTHETMPAERYSNFAIDLATRFQGCSMKEIQRTLNDFFNLVQGKGRQDMFDLVPVGQVMPLVDAIKRVYNIDFKPIKTDNNGQKRSNTVGNSNSESETRRQGRTGATEDSERSESGTGTADGGRGAEGDTGEGQEVIDEDLVKKAVDEFGRMIDRGNELDDKENLTEEEKKELAEIEDIAKQVTEVGENNTPTEQAAALEIIIRYSNFSDEQKAEAQKWLDDLRKKYGKSEVDNQGNPIDGNGKLITVEVGSIDELTDEDFMRPSRSVELPELPQKVQNAIGTGGKPVIIKKNVFEKNLKNHKDLTPEKSREILHMALYNTKLYGQNQKTTRPYNWILIHLADKHQSVIIEVSPSKDNCEIINWHYLDDETLKQKKRQAIREGGHILTLSEDSAAGNTRDSLASTGKDSKSSDTEQEKGGENVQGPNFDKRVTDLGDVSDKPTETFTKDMAYRETDINELDDILENGLMRSMPEGKTVEPRKDHDSAIGPTTDEQTKADERRRVNTQPSDAQKEAGNYKETPTLEKPTVYKNNLAGGNAHISIEGNQKSGYEVHYYDNVEDARANSSLAIGTEHMTAEQLAEHLQKGDFTAVEAYKSQYEKGWKVGTVTEVSREDFKKWVGSSHRKTKPFSEYKSVKDAAAMQQPTEPNTTEGQKKNIRELIASLEAVKGNEGEYHKVQEALRAAFRSMDPELLDAIVDGNLDDDGNDLVDWHDSASEDVKSIAREVYFENENRKAAEESYRQAIERSKEIKPQTPTKKVGALDFVSKQKGETHVTMKGVYHDGGYVVGINGVILYAERASYPEELEGKVTDKKGNEISGKYPDWRAVVAQVGGLHPLSYDADGLHQFVAGVRKEAGKDNYVVIGHPSEGNVEVYNSHDLDLFLRAAKKSVGEVERGTMTFADGSKRSVLFFRSEKGVGILMPAIREDISGEAYVYEPENVGFNWGFHRSPSRTEKPTKREAALRDGVNELMREAGIEVIDDAGEGQRVLDMANGPRLDKSKKRALETASPNLNGTDHQTVVSSTLGAKVLKNLDNLVNEYEFNKGNKPNTFIGDLSRALGAQKHGSNSEYATFETKNGRVVTIRLANHNAKGSTFDNHNESDGISIVITANNNAKLTSPMRWIVSRRLT